MSKPWNPLKGVIYWLPVNFPVLFKKMHPTQKKFCRHQWHADTINKVDNSGEQQSWYFCTYFMAKHLFIRHHENNIT